MIDGVDKEMVQEVFGVPDAGKCDRATVLFGDQYAFAFGLAIEFGLIDPLNAGQREHVPTGAEKNGGKCLPV